MAPFPMQNDRLVKTMTRIPDLIIPTADEIEAKKKEAFPYVLAEDWLNSTRVIMYADEETFPSDFYSEYRTWKFKTKASRLVFAAARIRELRREGVAEISAPFSRIYEICPDTRLSPAFGHKRRPLEW